MSLNDEMRKGRNLKWSRLNCRLRWIKTSLTTYNQIRIDSHRDFPRDKISWGMQTRLTKSLCVITNETQWNVQRNVIQCACGRACSHTRTIPDKPHAQRWYAVPMPWWKSNHTCSTEDPTNAEFHLPDRHRSSTCFVIALEWSRAQYAVAYAP